MGNAEQEKLRDKHCQEAMLSKPFPMTVLFDRVVIKRTRSEEKSEGGIYIPDSAKEQPCEGVIVATGPGKREGNIHFPLTVKVGNKIMFSKHAKMPIDIDGGEYYVMNEEDIIGILIGDSTARRTEAKPVAIDRSTGKPDLKGAKS